MWWNLFSAQWVTNLCYSLTRFRSQWLWRIHAWKNPKHKHLKVAYSWLGEWVQDSCPCRHPDEWSEKKKNIRGHLISLWIKNLMRINELFQLQQKRTTKFGLGESNSNTINDSFRGQSVTNYPNTAFTSKLKHVLKLFFVSNTVLKLFSSQKLPKPMLYFKFGTSESTS